MEPYIGAIVIFGFNFPPRGWAYCNGQLISIAQNTALFSLLGTMYGGDGQTTFALPDLRGRIPMQFGQGPGLSNRALGEASGVESVTMATGNLPYHNHSMLGYNGLGDTNAPTSGVFPAAGQVQHSPTAFYNVSGGYNSSSNTTLGATGSAGSGSPIAIANPYLALNFCVALEGIYPSRN